MYHHLISLLHNDTYNWYWCGALFLGLLTAPVSVVFSHVQQYRHHPWWRLASDSLVREQLAFLSYGVALFISAYFQADQKVLGPWFGILEVLGVLLYAMGLWLTSPSHLSSLHPDGEKCPADTTQPCEKPLRFGAKMQMVGMPLFLFAISLTLALFLTFAVTDGKSAATTQRESTLVPSDLGIAQVRAGAAAYRDAPAFVRDNLDTLDAERRAAKSPDHVVAIIESNPTISAYGHFCWAVTLAEDYQSDFGLSARAGYLMNSGAQPTFADLNVRGVGQPYTSIVAEVPTSSRGDKVVLVLSVYANTPGSKVLHEVGRMFHTEINCR